MGSSAEDCLCPPRWGVPSIVLAALIALICSDSSETLGPSSYPGSWVAAERLALSWLRKVVSSARHSKLFDEHAAMQDVLKDFKPL